jgi:hypothetical protein
MMIETSALPANPPSAQATGLGNGLARYTSALRSWQGVLIFLLAWLFGLILACLFAIGLLNYAPIPITARPVDLRIQIGLGLILISSLLFWIIVLRRYQQSRYAIELFQHGMRLDQPGAIGLNARWEEIDAIFVDVTQVQFLGLRGKVRWNVWLHLQESKPIRVHSGIERLPEAITRIKASFYPIRLAKYRQDIFNNPPAQFGPLTIHPDRLVMERSFGRPHKLEWEKISTINVDRGRVVIKDGRGKVYRYTIKRIPNLELFLEIVKQDIYL